MEMREAAQQGDEAGEARPGRSLAAYPRWRSTARVEECR